MSRQNIVALRTFRPSRTAFFLAVLLLLLILLAPAATRVEGATDDLCFPETGRCTSALFSTYWWEHGGLAQQGYPLSDLIDEVSPVDGRAYRVQYFERARFEYHPENAAPNNVLLGLLGREQYQAKYPAGRPSGGTGDQCFPETGRCVRGVFFAYWQQHGALAQQGLPLSDEFDEVSPVDGRMYRVQYFERARFEYHPENAGTPYVVLLGLLGHEQLLRQSPAVAPAAPFAAPAATAVPAATATPPIAPTATPTPTAGALDAEEAAFLALINAYRKQHSLGTLAVSATLGDAAAWLSADMAAKGYFAHTDSLGRDPFARMCAFGYCATAYKGENIAAGNATAQATFAQWQASAEHNANMLDPHYTMIGIGRAPGGTYGWYWTTDFGSAP